MERQGKGASGSSLAPKSKKETRVTQIKIGERKSGTTDLKTSPPVTRYEAAKVFDELDSDHKGYLSAEELMYFFSLIGQKSGKSEGVAVSAEDIRVKKMCQSLSISGAQLS